MGKMNSDPKLRTGAWRGWVAQKTREYVDGGADRNAPDLVNRMAIEGVPIDHPQLAWRESARQVVTKTLREMGYVGVPTEGGTRAYLRGEQLSFDGFIAYVTSQRKLMGNIDTKLVAFIEATLSANPGWGLTVAEVLTLADATN